MRTGRVALCRASGGRNCGKLRDAIDYRFSVGYLGIGTVAYQTMASLLPNAHLSPCEQASDTAYVQHTIAKNRDLTRGGKIYIPERADLGIEIDHEVLDSLTCEKLIIE